MKILVLCSGGDAPGMNRFVYEIVKAFPNEVFYAKAGFKGLVENKIYSLSLSEMEKVKNYIFTYLKSANFSARTCKSAYIRDEHHERIQRIVHVIGRNKITLSGYIDNVLTEHFENHRDEITKLYELSKPIF